ncbi:MAG TPA: biotin synthase BioB [Chitinivibrionales bacterium]|jgi:biotin synthase|nr:biotin synthase BioB [Chitinivibrionales bacterium]
MNLLEKAHDLLRKSLDDSITAVDLDTVIAWPVADLSLLFACADRVRNSFFGATVDPCALMNIKSGNCSEDCAFCSQSSHNTADVAIRELADEQEIVAASRAAAEKNLAFCVVSSGRRVTPAELKKVAAALKQCSGEKHASLGILSEEEFRLLKAAGVTCYNHNLETSRRCYASIVSTHRYDDRVNTVRAAQKAGLRVCCGGIFGMGETWEDRKALCLELRALNVDTIPMNFLIPIPGIRVAPASESPLEFLKIVSMFRLAHPRRTIKVCGGREKNLGPMQSLIFCAGANGYISGGYLTTQGNGIEADDEMIKLLGLTKKHVRKMAAGNGRSTAKKLKVDS